MQTTCTQVLTSRGYRSCALFGPRAEKRTLLSEGSHGKWSDIMVAIRYGSTK